MPKVVVTAQVEDSAKWEAGFLTHADLFHDLTVTAPVDYAINEGNEVAVYCEPAKRRCVHEGDGRASDRRGHGPGWRQAGDRQGVCLGQGVQGLAEASLTPGTTLGVSEVLSAIGAGGMGEVYKARDTKLDRDVALKILPEAFVNDAERLARFQREAKVLASLNHPNIAQIYGLKER